jgi:hypothetical protein
VLPCCAVLSCPAASRTETERKRKRTAAQHRDAKGNETGTHSGTLAAQERTGTNAGTAERTAKERDANRKPRGKEGTERGATFLPSFPFPLSFLFRPFRIPARTKGKNIFVTKKPFIASFRPFYFRSYKLEKINL